MNPTSRSAGPDEPVVRQAIAWMLRLRGKADYITTINKTKFKELGLAIPASFDDCACFVE